MTIETHSDSTVAEVISDEKILKTAADGLDLMGNLYYQGFGKVILHAENISAEFFDLRTGLAGEVLQKFATYRIRLAIVGDFSGYSSKSLRDFIYESNQGRQVNFVPKVSEAIAVLSR
jgi:hypothetical protein